MRMVLGAGKALKTWRGAAGVAPGAAASFSLSLSLCRGYGHRMVGVCGEVMVLLLLR